MKMAAILRLANALDADHLQKVRDVRVLREPDVWVMETEGAGDFTLERLAARRAATCSPMCSDANWDFVKREPCRERIASAP